MKILGIDPGIARAGWGVVLENKGKVSPVSYGCIETKAGLPVEDRLLALHEELLAIIHETTPDMCAIEELFFNTNAKTAFVVGQARGVMLLTAAEKKLPVAIYTPLQVKIAVTGYGRAEKHQVGQMVKTILQLSHVPKPDDVADALAIALTHAFSRKMKFA